MSGDHNLYQKWREHEAYAVPMTDEGMKLAGSRWHSYEAGYKQAIEDAMEMLLDVHESVKERHNYYHVAANMIKELTDA